VKDGIVEEKISQFSLKVVAGDDMDNEYLDTLTRSLRASLYEVPGVLDIEMGSSPLKPGAKGAASVLGEFIVKISDKAIPAVAGFFKDWIKRPGARPVEIEVQGKDGSAKIVFDPSSITANEIERLVSQLQANVNG